MTDECACRACTTASTVMPARSTGMSIWHVTPSGVSTGRDASPRPLTDSVQRRLDAIAALPPGQRGRIDFEAGQRGASVDLTARVGQHGRVSGYAALAWGQRRPAVGVRGSLVW